ncbi:transcriptional regulator, AsnC family [Palleronia salina]|uniref:Transcriptional regulator, AsnC family n=1 Tax=Palleronia salina TaxID=313368 RepID=A0A1M6BGQ2_9RHOB|nr:Lrp/AsnC ligand binding domain-containing protein [Palleronia salina]SHI47901.1 transcriptional regulator, AsnC family [Palleronia salina]
MKDNGLDQFDLAMLDVLGVEGRISVTELASRVGLSKSPVQARLKRLEQSGVITGYRALIDPVRLDREHVAFVEVKLTETRESALAAFNEAVRLIPEVEQCHLIAGDFDYLLKVRTADMVTYRAVLGAHISTLPYVAHTSTYVAMQSIKDSDSTPAKPPG